MERLDRIKREISNNGGSYDLSLLLQDSNNGKSNLNIFERLRERGKSLTFDYFGKPII